MGFSVAVRCGVVGIPLGRRGGTVFWLALSDGRTACPNTAPRALQEGCKRLYFAFKTAPRRPKKAFPERPYERPKKAPIRPQKAIYFSISVYGFLLVPFLFLRASSFAPLFLRSLSRAHAALDAAPPNHAALYRTTSQDTTTF